MRRPFDIHIAIPRTLDVSTKPKEEQPDRLDAFERISKTISIALIPVVLAIGGWLIQKQLQDQTIKRDYVQLAVSILKEPESSNISAEIREWAVRLLNDNSDTKLTPEAFKQLSNGSAILPGYVPSSRPIESLKPHVAKLARRLVELASAQGIEVKILKTMVTVEEQDEVYAQGRSNPGPIVTHLRGGQSMHDQGLAFDVVPLTDGKIDFNDKEKFKKLGEIGKSLGLTWGGDFRFKDWPHFEYREKEPVMQGEDNE